MMGEEHKLDAVMEQWKWWSRWEVEERL